MPIVFHTQTILLPKFKIGATRTWLANTAIAEGYKIKNINYVFMTDDELLQMNNDFLQHDYYTDIITFDTSSEPEQAKKWVVADLYISVDRVQDNATKHGVLFNHELMRVMVHGLLHLCGYTDKTKTHKTQMTAKENEYLSKLFI